MPSGSAMSGSLALLETCSDMVLQCSDGVIIPCIRYYCITTCEVIRNLVEDVELSHDALGRTAVPFPNVDSRVLALAIEVIHNIRTVPDLDEDTAPRALEGLRALGHTGLNAAITEHLWKRLCDAEFGAIQPHINELLHTRSVRLNVLRRLVVLRPLWTQFRGDVLARVAMTVKLATWMLPLLTKFYPAGPLFLHVLDALPLSVLDAPTTLSLFAAPGNATAYHPAEATDVVQALAKKFKQGGWDSATMGFLGALLSAMQVFDVAPHLANQVHGSVVLLDRTPVASMLLSVHERRGCLSRKMAPWLSLSVDWQAGRVDGRVSLDKVDYRSRYVRQCQLRLTAYAADAGCGELWFSYDNVHPGVPFSILQGRLHAGSMEAFRAVARDPSVQRLRVDLFYADHNVLHVSFF